MTAFATGTELLLWLGRDGAGATEQQRADMMVDLATETIEAEAHQPLRVSTDTIDVDGEGGRELQLPRTYVTDVTSVVIDGETLDVSAWTWSAAGIISRVDGGRWPRGDRTVTVTYTAGLDPVPGVLKRICLEAAARGMTNPESVGQQAIGDFNASFKTPGINLSTDNLRVIERFQP